MAMFCNNCGNLLNEAENFCASCGAQQQYQPPPQYQHQYAPVQAVAPVPNKKSKKPLIIGGIGGVLVIALIVVLITTNVFGLAGSGNNGNSGNNGGGTSSGSPSTATSGNNNNNSDRPGQSGDPANGSDGSSTDPNAPPTPTGDDAVSMNALVGLWHTKGFIDHYYWAFGADGRFAYYTTSGQQPAIGNSSPYASESYYKGNYRVSGSVIELYNVQSDSYFQYYGTLKYFSDRGDLTGGELLDTCLDEPERADDFSVMFEFKNASRLRIVNDLGFENHDSLFDYAWQRDNVEIPAHSLPGSEWPKDELPPDLPEYSAGRIKTTSSSNQYYIRIEIDGSTREDYIDYVERMVQAGWVWYSDSTESEFEEFKRGEDFRNSATFDKDSYQVTVSYSLNELNQAEIIWWK